jgi:hypothetical protein
VTRAQKASRHTRGGNPNPGAYALAGRRFSRWTVLKRAANTAAGLTRWECVCDCGTSKVVVGKWLVQGLSGSCGCRTREARAKLHGPRHPNWKGGRVIRPSGYVYVSNAVYPGSKPFTSTYEHIVVMARSLGRPLKPNETVHHKNGIRHDNRIENLELWASSHPAGQRVEDLVAWAKELLREYEPESLAALRCPWSLPDAPAEGGAR